MENLNKVLEKLYNTLGNEYLMDNFDTKPFEFKVNIRKGDNNDLQDYIVEVYSIPHMPKVFKYKSGKGKGFHGAHISVFKNKLKEFIKYVDSSFGVFGKTYGIKFMSYFE